MPVIPSDAGATPAAASSAGTPFPSPVSSTGSPFPSTGATGVATQVATDDADDEPVRRRHPYTWLHLVVLALVAFVLGFLIMALWQQGKTNGAGGTSGAAALVVVAPPGSSSAA